MAGQWECGFLARWAARSGARFHTDVGWRLSVLRSIRHRTEFTGQRQPTRVSASAVTEYGLGTTAPGASNGAFASTGHSAGSRQIRTVAPTGAQRARSKLHRRELRAVARNVTALVGSSIAA